MTVATTRLHISPLTPELLPTLLGSAFNGLAQNISYHSIQTFPEKSYGYLDLPTADAEKLKKKLNGALLKGSKMKVEDAKPKKRRLIVTEEVSTEQEPQIRKVKKSKKEHNVVDGRELSPDRKVKRGWTEPKNEKVKKAQSKDKKEKLKAQAPSQFTEKEELLFKTKLPSNRKSEDKKDKKSKKRSKEDIVHEFRNTTIQPSFLRSNTSKKAEVEYIDGKGWVDSDGNIVEEESQTASRKRKVANSQVSMAGHVPSRRRQLSTSSSSSSDTSSDESETSTSSGDETTEKKKKPVLDKTNNDETSSSGSSSDSTSETDSSDEEKQAGESDLPQVQSSPEAKKTRKKPDLTINPPTPIKAKSSTNTSQSNQSSVHPLEALFKKPARPATRSQFDQVKPSLELEATTSFSFFDNQDANSDEDKTGHDSLSLVVPSTPFTTQDLRNREIRSAAPTPDTAHPSRFNSLHNSLIPDPMDLTDTLIPLKHVILHEEEETSDDSTDEEESDDDKAVTSPTTATRKQKDRHPSTKDTTTTIGKKLEESEFEKRFWQNRGDNNRAWKAKRRIALKEKRQRENRSRRTKNW